MNGFQQVLASILNPGGRMSAGGNPFLAGVTGVQPGNALSSMSAPQAVAAPVAAPEQAPAPMPQAEIAPQQQQGMSGGVGGFLGNLFGGREAAARNQTVGWLQQQGLDQGTATLLAGNKAALQRYLLDRSKGSDPMDALKLEKTQLEIEQMRNPTTDDVREYQFARQQGYEGNFTDYMQDMRKAGAQNITVGGGKYGTIPTGYELVEGPEGAQLRPIPGGPVASEMEAAEKARLAKSEQDATATSIVTDDIDRALQLIETSTLPTTGMFGDFMSGVGGTAARDLRALLDTVKAKAGFRELQAMRDASPTGGALGAISERELALLQATIGNLEQSQSADQLKRNLLRVRSVYDQIINGPQSETSRQKRAGGGLGAPSPGTVEDGYRFKGGDPGDPNSWEKVN